MGRCRCSRGLRGTVSGAVCIRIEVVVTCAVAVDIVVPGIVGIRMDRGIGIIAVIAAMDV